MAGLDLGFRMHAERTPNPNSIKWVLSKEVATSGSADFDSAPESDVSSLTADLFAVDGVARVYLGPNFVTVTKTDALEWTDLAEPIVTAIKGWAASDAPALGPGWVAPDLGPEGEVVTRIRQILDDEIRPYVAQDGGEISFVGFREGVVEVMLQGACSGCPSSTITLKMGIEHRLKEEIPEVTSVVAV